MTLLALTAALFAVAPTTAADSPLPASTRATQLDQQIDWSRAGAGKMAAKTYGKVKPARPRKRKSAARWLVGEIWDAVEDVFD